MTRLSPLQQLNEAKKIAHDHGCFVAEKGGQYLVYRRTAAVPAFLGKRGTPEALRTLVCKLTNFH